MNNIERWRRNADVKQEDFARMIRVTQSTASKICNGNITRYSADMVDRIMKVTGLTSDQVLGLVPYMPAYDTSSEREAG